MLYLKKVLVVIIVMIIVILFVDYNFMTIIYLNLKRIKQIKKTRKIRKIKKRNIQLFVNVKGNPLFYHMTRNKISLLKEILLHIVLNILRALNIPDGIFVQKFGVQYVKFQFLKMIMIKKRLVKDLQWVKEVFVLRQSVLMVIIK